MKKLDDLRQFLINRIDDFKTSPDRLLTYIEDGRILFYNSADQNLSHEYQADINILVTDWDKSTDVFTVPILEWMRVRTPGRNPIDSILFETEELGGGKRDILITLKDISERVIVTVNDTGKLDVKHQIDEPIL